MKKYNYIYLITNKTNGKIYIGKHSTNKLDDGYMGSGKLILKAEQKYGIENFTKDYLAFCDSEETLNYLEKFYIKKYKAREIGYNLTDGGDGSCGYIVKEETKEKNRQSHLGKKCSNETKFKISQSNKGRIKSKEECYKISEGLKGLNKTEEHKKHLSESLKGKLVGEKNPNFGKHHIFGPMTDEHKQKLSESNKHPHKKVKWQTSTGEIKIMDVSNAHRHHPDWIKIGEA